MSNPVVKSSLRRVLDVNARRGVLEVTAWDRLLKETVKIWETQGGCRLTPAKSACPKSAPFNFWEDEALIIFEDDAEVKEGAKVTESHTRNAKIEYSSLPFLNRDSVKTRPSLLVFHVTGHVMLGIYFGNLDTPELHIFNPWKVTGTVQMKDVYNLFEENLGIAGARKPVYIDVAGQLEDAKKIDINLQEDEQVGFCTLWVTIIASKVISLLKDPTFDEAVKSASKSGSLLNPGVLDRYYKEVYEPLITEVNNAKTKEDPTLGYTWIDFTNYNAAVNVKKMALEALTKVTANSAKKGGKRKRNRRTYRKKLTWRRRRGRRFTQRI
jgi:hypothetical protein